MVLAAGYGTRLAPITDHLPKPLLPVSGGTVLDRAIANLDSAGIEQIAVNTHHLGAMVAGHLAARTDARRFSIFPEPEILGTGGALDGARDFLAAAPFFVLHNGDVLADLDLGALAKDHRRSGALATLVLVDWPAVNTVRLADDGSVLAIGGATDPAPPTGAGDRMLTYAGVGAFSREMLADIGPGFSSLIDPLVRAMAARPGSVRGFVPRHPAWTDLGTLPRYLERVADAGPLTTPAAALQPITGHGSDRRFWRLALPDWSVVAMQSPPSDEEFGRQVAISRFLRDEDLGAPALLTVHEDQKTLLMEDVGAASLSGIAPDQRAAAYGRTVDHLLRLQAATERARTACPEVVDRALDKAALAWETDYFRQRFLEGHAGCRAEQTTELAGEFALLNTTVAAQPLVLMHRDFQSQNIHLQGDRVRLVDVQGMRLGPLGYDAASLLWDPYVDAGHALRTGLLEQFCRGAAAATARQPVLQVPHFPHHGGEAARNGGVLNLLVQGPAGGFVQGRGRRHAVGAQLFQARHGHRPQQDGEDERRGNRLIVRQPPVGVVHGGENQFLPDLALGAFQAAVGFREQKVEQAQVLQLLHGGPGVAAEEQFQHLVEQTRRRYLQQ